MSSDMDEPERLESVKTPLWGALKEGAPGEEILATVFAEAEFVVKSRPPTEIEDDPDADTPWLRITFSSAINALSHLFVNMEVLDSMPGLRWYL